MGIELLDIEKDLAGEDAQAKMEAYDQQLCALSDRIKATLDAGVTPDDFPKCKALADAVVIARKLLRLQLRTK